MAQALPPLPYDYGSLEPHVDATTMNIHHTKHHQTYVNNLNAALDKFPELKDLGLVDLNKAVGTDKLPKDVATVIRNNGGGHYNHSFFWKASHLCGMTFAREDLTLRRCRSRALRCAHFVCANACRLRSGRNNRAS